MSQTASGRFRNEKWYSKNVFPLIPLLEIKKANEHSTSGFTFRWLFITIWTLDNVQFEFGFVADTHWGIGLIGLLPFLRWVIAIPCPEPVGIWWDKLTSRRVRI